MTAPTAVRRNAYPGACIACQQLVPAQGGLLLKQNGRWVVRHDSDCPAPQAAPQPLEVGIYVQGDRIFKVQKSQRSERRYAKVLVKINGDRLNEDGYVVDWRFEYAPRAIESLTAADRLSLEAARLFGIQYGVCCACGAHLEEAESLAYGVGPVCRKKF